MITLKQMKLTHWRLSHPELLQIHPKPTMDENILPHYDLCVVGDPPSWLNDLLQSLSVTNVHHCPQLEDVQLCSAEWLLVFSQVEPPIYHPKLLLIPDDSGSSKKQLWQQICCYERH